MIDNKWIEYSGVFITDKLSYYDRKRECWLNMGGGYQFYPDTPYIFCKDGRNGYRVAGIWDVLKFKLKINWLKLTTRGKP